MTSGRRRARPIVGSSPRRLAWVFAGGGARGAYEVGVCSYIFDRVASAVGRPLPVDVISGTSVGAINACALATGVEDPGAAIARLVERWTELSLEQVVHLDKRRTFNMVRALFGRGPRNPSPDAERGGILDARPIEELLSAGVDFQRIAAHVAAGRLLAVSVSATHLDSGATTVFYQCAGEPPPVARGTRGHPAHRHTDYERVDLQPAHALASAAIPFLFPAVRVAGELYCDGSLRQHVPLSPARVLGADALVVVNPRSGPPADAPGTAAHGGDDARGKRSVQGFPGPLFLLGKTLNALTFDRVDSDIHHLERLNHVLAAGERRFGTSFLRDLNATLEEEGRSPVRPLSVLHLQASQNLGQLSADFVRTRRKRGRGSRRSGWRAGGLVGRTFARLAEAERGNEGDLLSYLLFEGEFAAELIDLGRQDAARRHDELVAFFAALIEPLDGSEAEEAGDGRVRGRG